MKYTRSTIDVATRQGKVTIPAMIAGDTGLAYHGYLNMDLTVSSTLLQVSHVGTGLAVRLAKSATQARVIISKLIEIKSVDWKLDSPLENMSTKDYRATKRAISEITV